MEAIELLGYFSAVLIGISLGLIGGGGSILTVPVLVYLFGIEPVMSTAYSLFIVGLSALVGGLNMFRKKLVSLQTALFFGIPSIIAVFVTRKWIVPAIPDQLFSIGSFTFTKGPAIMVLFALLMIFASIKMIRSGFKKGGQDKKKAELTLIMRITIIGFEGLIVGLLTGLVGAGGGFLIIPALVLLTGMEMKKAVGTSLFIIAAKSLIGFTGDLSNYAIDWQFLLVIAGLAVGGIFLGGWIGNFISGNKLKPIFGWFVLIMGLYILGKELILRS